MGKRNGSAIPPSAKELQTLLLLIQKYWSCI